MALQMKNYFQNWKVSQIYSLSLQNMLIEYTFI
jgi:hypothetical protein